MARMNLRIACIALLLTISLAASFAPNVAASHGYDQSVWIPWDTTELDVLVVGVSDPVVGEAIREGIAVWDTGLNQLAPAWLSNALEIRVYFPAFDPVPPAGFEPDDIEILFVPQGFMAIYHSLTGEPECIATAPSALHFATELDLDSLYRVTSHEFGHCLGLSHVFNHGIEYAPAFDIMGSGHVSGGAKACPSNLNIQVLERAYGPLLGRPGAPDVFMPASSYFQSTC